MSNLDWYDEETQPGAPDETEGCIGKDCLNPAYLHDGRECFTAEDVDAWEAAAKEGMRRERWPLAYLLLDAARATWRRLRRWRRRWSWPEGLEGADDLPF